jgi:hypothetical protein
MLAKLKGVILINSAYFTQQWDFISGFWISLASNKNREVQDKTMEHLLPIIVSEVRRGEITQVQLVTLYEELAKLNSLCLAGHIIDGLKQLVLSVGE